MEASEKLNQVLKTTPEDEVDVHHLKSEVEYRTKLQEISNQIYAAFNLDEILIDLKDDIVDLIGAERITIYYVDGIKRELVSRFKSGEEIAEIRVPISDNSIAGYAATHQQMLNIKDVYDTNELNSLDASLKFDSRWDKRSGFRTKQVLAAPILFKSYLLGVIQLINRRSGGPFTRRDEDNIRELTKIMGIALYKQKRMASQGKGKFDYLLENHILTQKELNNAVSKAREKREPVENLLISDFKIPKKEVGIALSRYFDMPLVEYNSTMPIPGELLQGLKVKFMRNNAWVPIRSENGDIIIAIDNPDDIRRIDEIKTLFPKKSIKLNIAIKDDILKLIDLFTTEGPQSDSSIDDILSQLDDGEEVFEEEASGVSEESSAVVQLVNKIILDAHH